jgi:hypothetical protein
VVLCLHACARALTLLNYVSRAGGLLACAPGGLLRPRVDRSGARSTRDQMRVAAPGAARRQLYALLGVSVARAPPGSIVGS